MPVCVLPICSALAGIAQAGGKRVDGADERVVDFRVFVVFRAAAAQQLNLDVVDRVKVGVAPAQRFGEARLVFQQVVLLEDGVEAGERFLVFVADGAHYGLA